MHTNKQNKKGFTVTELLAVISVIVIISLIAVPTTIFTIRRSQKHSFKMSVLGVMNAADYYSQKNSEYDLKFICDGDSCATENAAKLDINGNTPLGGSVYVTVDAISVEQLTNGVFCATGTKENLKIEDDCNGLDDTPPVIDDMYLSYSAGTDFIDLFIAPDYAIDEESGIDHYDVILSLGDEIISKRDVPYSEEGISVSFKKLKSDTKYKIQVIAVNGNDLETEKSLNVRTKNIEDPVITYTNNPSTMTNGYLKSQIIKVDYKDTEGKLVYYVKTTKDGTSNINASASCGNDIMPQECSNISATKSLSANTWYKVNSNIEITYSNSSNDSGSIYALVSDNTNYTNLVSGSIAKIDGIDPTYSFSISGTSYGSGYKSGAVVTVTCSDSESGIASGSNTVTLSKAGTNTVSGTCVDNAGNKTSYSKDYTIYVYSASASCGYQTCESASCGVAEYNTCSDSSCGYKTCATEACGCASSTCTSYNTCSLESFGCATYKSCANSSCTCKTYKTCENKACGYKSCANSACGYKSCETSACGNKTCATSACGCSTYKTCANKACGYKSCANAACGYKSCANSACGYKTCANSACGTTSNCTSKVLTTCTAAKCPRGYTDLGNGKCDCLLACTKENKTCATSACGNKTCETSACGNKTCETSACGNKSCATEACGCSVYKSCANSACGYKTCENKACGNKTCETSACGNKSCATEACGCDTYNSCRNSSCGCETYNSKQDAACGCKTTTCTSYKSCANAACGYKTCESPSCGVKRYKSCATKSCGYETCWHT